jgi:hypothetical protein
MAEKETGGGTAERFFLVVVGDSAEDAPRIIECDDQSAFLTAVGEHVLNAKQTISAFGFKGQRIQISAPSPVCAVEIDGKRADVGSDDRSFDSTGRITPLKRGE